MCRCAYALECASSSAGGIIRCLMVIITVSDSKGGYLWTFFNPALQVRTSQALPCSSTARWCSSPTMASGDVLLGVSHCKEPKRHFGEAINMWTISAIKLTRARPTDRGNNQGGESKAVKLQEVECCVLLKSYASARRLFCLHTWRLSRVVVSSHHGLGCHESPKLYSRYRLSTAHEAITITSLEGYKMWVVEAARVLCAARAIAGHRRQCCIKVLPARLNSTPAQAPSQYYGP